MIKFMYAIKAVYTYKDFMLLAEARQCFLIADYLKASKEFLFLNVIFKSA
jgi:hypothetical protein